jgi:glycine C-acetyltransferase
MKHPLLNRLGAQLAELKQNGLYKEEREITSPQNNEITVAGGKKVLNFCANNYLGLADHPDVIDAARSALDHWGFGLASVRFICGTQTVHKKLEAKITQFLGTEDTILFSSCFDANGGLFEAILGPEDAVISDALNHASIIDGIRLCKAQRFRYNNNDMADLEKQLQAAEGARTKLIATDGVFSMDGIIANLSGICDLAEKYGALVMIDDCHAAGFIGATGRGTPEHCGVKDRVHIITGTLGKALSGGSGGYISGKKEVVAWLRQRARPYLFSNTLAPSIAAASIRALELVDEKPELRKHLKEMSGYFRHEMSKLGFTLVPGEHPIIPVMLGDAKLAKTFADKMLEKGIYVVGFSYPVVPEGKARIRTQLSAAHTKADVDHAIAAFKEVGKTLGVIK